MLDSKEKDLNLHTIITTDSCIRVQRSSLNILVLKEKFSSLFIGLDEGIYYAHVFNRFGFPIDIKEINVYSCEGFVHKLCLSIKFGFLSYSIGEDIIYSEDNFYVFVSKDYNSKFELMIL